MTSGRQWRLKSDVRPEDAAETRSHEMTQYLISFDDSAMTVPEEELPDVAEAAQAVAQEAKDAGVWVFGGGLKDHEEASMVASDGTVTDGPAPGRVSASDVLSEDPMASDLSWPSRLSCWGC